MGTSSNQKSTFGTGAISWLLALIYLAAIIGIEVSLLLGTNPGWGILIYGFMLVSLLVFAALDPENGPLLIGLSAVPIVRIVAYGIPFSNTTLTTHFGIIGLILLFYIIPAVRMPKLEISHILALPRNWAIQLSIVISGVIVGFCQSFVFPQETLYFSGLFELIAFIAVLVLSAFVEEVIFRGIVLAGFAKRFSQSFSVIFVAFIYTSLFIPFGSIELGLVIFLTSLFYGLLVIRYSGLYGVIGAHFVSSIFYYLILPAILK